CRPPRTTLQQETGPLPIVVHQGRAGTPRRHRRHRRAPAQRSAPHRRPLPATRSSRGGHGTQHTRTRRATLPAAFVCAASGAVTASVRVTRLEPVGTKTVATNCDTQPGKRSTTATSPSGPDPNRGNLVTP